MTQTSVTPEPLPLTDTLLFVALCEISSTQTGKVMQLFVFFRFRFVGFCVRGRGSHVLPLPQGEGDQSIECMKSLMELLAL